MNSRSPSRQRSGSRSPTRSPSRQGSGSPTRRTLGRSASSSDKNRCVDEYQGMLAKDLLDLVRAKAAEENVAWSTRLKNKSDYIDYLCGKKRLPERKRAYTPGSRKSTAGTPRSPTKILDPKDVDPERLFILSGTDPVSKKSAYTIDEIISFLKGTEKYKDTPKTKIREQISKTDDPTLDKKSLLQELGSLTNNRYPLSGDFKRFAKKPTKPVSRKTPEMSPSEIEMAPSDATIPMLKDYLKRKGIKFTSKDRKADLVELVRRRSRSGSY